MVWIEAAPLTVRLPRLKRIPPYSSLTEPPPHGPSPSEDERELLMADENPPTEPLLSVTNLGFSNVVVLTSTSVYLYQTDPFVCVSAHVRSEESIERHGNNLQAKAMSASRFLVSTSESYLLVYLIVNTANHNHTDAMLVYNGPTLLQTGYPLHSETTGWFGFTHEPYERPLHTRYVVLQRALKVGMGLDGFWGKGETVLLAGYDAGIFQTVHQQPLVLNKKIAVASLSWYASSAPIAHVVASTPGLMLVFSQTGEVYQVTLSGSTISGLRVGTVSMVGTYQVVYNQPQGVLWLVQGARIEVWAHDLRELSLTRLTDLDAVTLALAPVTATVVSVAVSPSGHTHGVLLSNGQWLLTTAWGISLFNLETPSETTAISFLDDLTFVAVTPEKLSLFPLRRFEASSLTACVGSRAASLLFRSRERLTLVSSASDEPVGSIRLPPYLLKNPNVGVKLNADGLKVFAVAVEGDEACEPYMLVCAVTRRAWYPYKQDYMSPLRVVGFEPFHKTHVVILHRLSTGDELVIFNVEPLFLPPSHPRSKEEFTSEMIVWRYELPAPLVAMHVDGASMCVVLNNNAIYHFRLEVALDEGAATQLVIRNNKVIKPLTSTVDMALLRPSVVVPLGGDQTLYLVGVRGSLYALYETKKAWTLKLVKVGVEAIQPDQNNPDWVSFLAFDGYHIYDSSEAWKNEPLVISVESGRFPVFFSAAEHCLYHVSPGVYSVPRKERAPTFMVKHRIAKQILLSFLMDWYLQEAEVDAKKVPGLVVHPKLTAILVSASRTTRLKAAFEILLIRYLTEDAPLARLQTLITVMHQSLSRLQYYEITIDGLRKLEVTYESPSKSGALTYKRFFGLFFEGRTPSEVLEDLIAEYNKHGSAHQYKVLMAYFMVYLNYQKDLEERTQQEVEDFVRFTQADRASLSAIWSHIVANADWESGLDFITWLRKLVAVDVDKEFLALLIAQTTSLAGQAGLVAEPLLALKEYSIQ